METFDAPGAPILDLRAWWGAIAVFGMAYLLGAALCFRFRAAEWIDDALVRLTAGLALTPVLLLMAAPPPQFRAAVYSALGVAGFALLGRELYRRRPWKDAPTESPGDARDGGAFGAALGIVGWALTAILLFALLGPAFSPPLGYDSLEYHVGAIPRWFEADRIRPVPHIFYTAQPIATEMLYALSAFVEGAPRGAAPGATQWLLTLFAAGLMVRLLRAMAALAALVPWLVVFFLTHPIVARATFDRLTDLTGAVFLLGGWLALAPRLAGRGESKNPLASDLWIAGLTAGGAISSKWTNAGTAALLVLAASAVALARARGAGAPRPALAAAAGAAGVALIMLPWSAWLWIHAGNPLAPFAARLFPTEAWPPARLDFLLHTHGLTSPVRWEYWRNLYDRLSSPELGPPLALLCLAAALGVVMVSGRRREDDDEGDASDETHQKDETEVAEEIEKKISGPPPAFYAAAFAAIGVGLLLWGRLLDAATRFLTPIFAAEFVVLGALMGALSRRVASKFRSASIFAIVVVIAPIGPARYLPRGAMADYLEIAWEPASGFLTTRRYVSERMGPAAEFFEVANAFAQRGRGLAVGEAQGFYLSHRVTLATVFDRHPLRDAIDDDPTPESIERALVEMGYAFILVNEVEIARLLRFHPPPVLLADPIFMELRAEGAVNDPILAAGFMGYVEFGPEPLTDPQRAAYDAFLRELRGRAEYFNAPPTGHPAFWIATLDPD